jgi:hypothetical protein
MTGWVMELDSRADKLESATPGTSINLPVQEEDIGPNLLLTLSSGLYTDPLDCIREYVQNSVDGRAASVLIKATANSIYILDDGHGMGANEIINARKVGVSEKDVKYKVGFRGIGIYSATAFCKRIIVSSKRRDEGTIYTFVIDCDKFKKALPKPNENKEKAEASLKEILESSTYFKVENGDADADQYTMVQLEDVSTYFMSAFKDTSKLKRYILRNLPIDFDQEFEWKSEINAEIKGLDPSYNPVVLKLELDDADSIVVTRPRIPELDRPNFIKIKNNAGKTLAICWGCLRKPDEGRRGKIPDKYADFHGFVYKYKGFTVGTNQDLKPIFRTGGGALFQWYTGEIYVIDQDIIPDAPRSGFEANEAFTEFQVAAEKVLLEYQSTAEKYRREERAIENLEAINTEITDWMSGFKKFGSDLVQLIEWISLVRVRLATIKDLKSQVNPEKVQVVEEVERIAIKFSKSLEKQRKTLMAPHVISDADQLPANQPETTSPTAINYSPQTKKVNRRNSESLTNIVTSSRIKLNLEAKQLVETIDRGLRIYIGEDSDEYKAFIKFLSDRYN